MNLKKHTKQLMSAFLAVIMCCAMNIHVFAAEPIVNSVPETEAVSFNEDTGIMPLSSVSGYVQKTITKDDNYIFIDCDGSGWGGMGLTIKTSCSSGTYDVEYAGAATVGKASTISQRKISTNDEQKFTGLYQMDLGEYFITFKIPDGTPSFLVQVWIYG